MEEVPRLSDEMPTPSFQQGDVAIAMRIEEAATLRDCVKTEGFAVIENMLSGEEIAFLAALGASGEHFRVCRRTS